MIKKLNLLLFAGLISVSTLMAQIQSGPMLGYSEMREVLLWVQTKKEASVKFVYWDKTKPAIKYATEEFKTTKSDAFVARLIADQVLPGKKYAYEVWIDKKKVALSYPLEFQTQALWQWRTDPPAFKFAVGSCAYINETEFDRPGTPYGSEYEIFTSIYQSKPDFMLWSGDNIYLREPDWNTKTGIMKRYTHTRSLPEMQPLLGSIHNYAIWDDHDFGPNDADRGFVSKKQTLDAFKLFWGNLNYTFKDEGVTGSFQWADCQFFLMDDRWWRTPNDRTTGGREYFGQKQIQWLVDALKFSNAPFKFVIVGGQVGNPAKIFENFVNYEEERNQLFELITKEKIPGVIFISGDRHWTALTKVDRPGTYPLYDLTISALTSGPSKPVKEEADSPYVEGTTVTKHNYGLLEISGKRTDRVLKINVLDKDGKELWTREIKASELK
ncbi:alkaline phosphatase [Emticicia sp. 21SJ11W-3]|uniref:alkaline phosphatase D family protein n=1 Tax=Emticicia sp. 21SJ11W-3 TaxID=2916755 RepID=UPI00209DEC6D|nr:alkaline phosphatase D family protein [Emticicia sp. 21SJ11W-3]UTA69122.1 alkaline phosphatase family protein [Emticicia sp. 21SJ11W-3]